MNETPKPLLPGEFDVDLQYQMGEPIIEDRVEASPKLDKSFKPSKSFLDFFNKLIDEKLAVGDKRISTKLVSVKFFRLESARSIEDVKKALEGALEKKLIKEKDYKLLLGLIDKGDSTKPTSKELLGIEKEVEKEKTLEQLQEELNTARSDYVERLTAWRSENRKNKTVFSGLMSNLGVEKQMPQRSEPEDLQDSEEDYRRAKKNLFTLLIKNLSKESNGTATKHVLEVIENEKQLLKIETEKSWTDLERKILEKAEKRN
ncbi:MAG: hypothetical protein EXS47_02245 [Candidatus Zambryskibacteria bacterium]|nr:hypothetical protein [Candidatus Zambryskibacteria bacterium]